MNKDTQLIWEASPLPEPKPRGVTIQQPSYDEIKSDKDYMKVGKNLYDFIKENKLTVVDIGETGHGIVAGLTRGTEFDKTATKKWFEISDKLLLERVFTKDIKNLNPDMYAAQETLRRRAHPELKENTGWMDYISLYKADFFSGSSLDRPRPMPGPAQGKGGLTSEQLMDVIENAPNEMLSTSQFDQKEVINKLTKVAIIKRGWLPHFKFQDRSLLSPMTSGNKRREKTGAFKIEILYADDNSPLHDLYDSTLPLELKRNIDESLREIGYKEGEKSETSSLTRSRSSSLIEKAKQENIEKYGALTCTKCGIQPAIDYYQKNQKVSPSLASKIIEGHHIHGVRETEQATTEDIEILCSNCHIYETRISN